MTKSETKPKTRSNVKYSLIQQLKEMGADVAHFRDLVDDYMSLFDIKNKLNTDIRRRGVVIEWQNSKTQKGMKKNDSVSELVKVNAQMLKILQQLHIETVDVGDVEDDEDF